MKTIIVPVNFSATAANAAAFAVNLATFYNADVWLYHCYDTPVSVAGNPFPIAMEQLQNEQDAAMQAFKKQVLGKMKFPMRLQSKTEANTLQRGLEAFCKELAPDLVIMGLSGKTGFAKMLSGSNTIKAIHYLNYPVLVIPHDVEFIPVRKIGFACNYDKALHSSPINILEKIVKDFNAELHIVNVHPHYKGYKPQEILEGMFVDGLLKKVKPEYHVIESEDITEGINLFADEAHLDWIAAIPKSHNLVDKIFRHSHTKDLLHHTHVPVLCMHD